MPTTSRATQDTRVEVMRHLQTLGRRLANTLEEMELNVDLIREAVDNQATPYGFVSYSADPAQLVRDINQVCMVASCAGVPQRCIDLARQGKSVPVREYTRADYTPTGHGTRRGKHQPNNRKGAQPL